MKKFVACLLIACFMITGTLCVYAAQPEAPAEPLYTNIISPAAALSKSGSCTADCTGQVRVSNSYSTTLKLYLQQSDDGGVTYSNYCLVDSDTFYGNGLFTVMGSEDVETGYKYRLRLYMRVYDENGSLLDYGDVYTSGRNF